MKKIEKNMYETIPFLSRLLALASVSPELYIEGDIPEITFDEYGRAIPRVLTVVGSRKHTTYGKDAIETLL